MLKIRLSQPTVHPLQSSCGACKFDGIEQPKKSTEEVPSKFKEKGNISSTQSKVITKVSDAVNIFVR